MARHRVLSKTEMKILIFKKVKQGMSYEAAKKQLGKEIEKCIKNSKKAEKKPEKSFKQKFMEDKNEM